MQRIVHSMTCLLLALALTLAGPGNAGSTQGMMLVELCIEKSSRLVWVDDSGLPAEPEDMHDKCLYCLVFSNVPPEAGGQFLILAQRRVPAGLSLPARPEPHSIAHLRPIPRGPPLAEGHRLRIGDPRPHPWSRDPETDQAVDVRQSSVLSPVTDLRAIAESART